jgi:hypothetical protein
VRPYLSTPRGTRGQQSLRALARALVAEVARRAVVVEARDRVADAELTRLQARHGVGEADLRAAFKRSEGGSLMPQ